MAASVSCPGASLRGLHDMNPAKNRHTGQSSSPCPGHSVSGAPVSPAPVPCLSVLRIPGHCSALPSFFGNEDFVKSVTALAKKAKCRVTICPQEENQDDQWMQVCGPAWWTGRGDPSVSLPKVAQATNSLTFVTGTCDSIPRASLVKPGGKYPPFPAHPA